MTSKFIKTSGEVRVAIVTISVFMMSQITDASGVVQLSVWLEYVTTLRFAAPLSKKPTMGQIDSEIYDYRLY